MSNPAMLILSLLLMATAGTAATASGRTKGDLLPVSDRIAIEKIVHDYILSHPEILPEAMENLRANEAAKVIRTNRHAIETPFAGAWEGAADADVTVVEFFDYNCGFCRKSLPDIDRLLAEDKRVRIVYREFPVLGPDSDNAARISLAAAKSGKYPDFHRAVYALDLPEPGKVEKIAKGMGIDTGFATDHVAQAEIDANLTLARTLSLTGTPSWVVGNRLLTGAVGYEALKQAIADARVK